MGIEWNEESVGGTQPEVPSMDNSNTIPYDLSLSHDFGATRSSSCSRVLPARLQDYVIINDNDVSDEEL
ncbi:hypothetical protein U1Q18_027224, partial [Sarracenia purpurea var. burkii]